MSGRRVASMLGAAFAFGLFAAWAKGQNTDGLSAVSQVRTALGNLSTPWLLVAFLAGGQSPRIRTGTLLGLLATMTALTAFYLLTTAVVDLGGHGYLQNLRLELSANRGYFEGGLVTGPLLGALGAWWRQTRSVRASVLAGGLMMAEPLVLVALGAALPGGVLPQSGLPLLVRMLPGWGLGAHSGTIPIVVYGAEFMVGLAVVLVAVRRSGGYQRGRGPLGGAADPAGRGLA